MKEGGLLCLMKRIVESKEGEVLCERGEVLPKEVDCCGKEGG